MPRLLIVGGSDAGISAACVPRELAPEWEVTVAGAQLLQRSTSSLPPPMRFNFQNC
jgi:hypothetical protein